ncbi:hypothetical protein [Rickettsia sp. TH2014]|uniref:hypothetical protein n=1 Tax=Rickettsia sp. TH2014 TaxID=1967503 RepID=UPI001C43B3B1|nr:hypothetical protein [Rickettsia sp. TH2014]
MTTTFQLLTSGNIQYIPQFLNGTNVNELNNSLNIFETLCNLIPQQQDKNVKNILENTAIQTLGKMISIPETNWGKKDGAGNTILEWGIWSGSAYTTTKFIAIEKAQMQNFTRVLKSNHLASTFQNEQIEKFKQISLDINIPDTRTPCELLNTGRIQDIMSVPTALNKDNVNNVNNNLNIFETLCNLIPQQQDQNVKNALENTAVQILSKMISIPETKIGVRKTGLVILYLSGEFGVIALR